MSRNGRRRPPRPRIEMISPVPGPAEAAAIAAAIERFVADTIPSSPPSRVQASPWQRNALLEGARASDAVKSPWGDPSPWGARPAPPH